MLFHLAFVYKRPNCISHFYLQGFSKHLFLLRNMISIVHSAALSKKNLWSKGKRTVHCIPAPVYQMSYWWYLSSSETANLKGPLHTSITVSPPHHLFFFLALFSVELHLSIVLSSVKGTKDPPPPSFPVQNPPIEMYFIAIRMGPTCQMTDMEWFPKEYGSYLTPDSLTALLVNTFEKLYIAVKTAVTESVPTFVIMSSPDISGALYDRSKLNDFGSQ